MDSNPITIRQIARKAGVSKTTVAKALNHQSRISEETRARVVDVAASLGYRVDARLNMLMSYLRHAHSARNAVNLAWLTYSDQPLKSHLEDMPWVRGYWMGAQSRAAETGFSFDEFWLMDPQLTPKRISSILKARGVQGLILFSPWNLPAYPSIPWDEYPAVIIGTRRWPRNFHRASFNFFSGMQLVLAKLKTKGFRRIGLWWSVDMDVMIDNTVSSAFFHYQHGIPSKDRIPWVGEKPMHFPNFKAWLKKHRPEVVVCCDNRLLKACQKAGLQVPRDLSVVHLNLCEDVAGWAGLNRSQFDIGVAAIDMIAGQLNRGDKGAPQSSRETLLPGLWTDGFTLGDPKNLAHPGHATG